MKILKIITILVLIVLPFSSVLSNFSPYWTSNTFQVYLFACLVFAVISFLLGDFIAGKRRLFSGWGILFFLGVFVAPPFMLGPPELSPKLLELVSEEHFRYGMLMISTFVFALGFLFLIKKLQSKSIKGSRFVIIPFTACVGLMIWDNYSSYRFSSEMQSWIASGKHAEDFVLHFNFNEFWRTLGRTLLYILVPWLGFGLLKMAWVKKWQVITLSIFCFIGTVVFFLTNFIGMEFYFPFMVPAVALAPAYWLGIALLVQQNK